MAAIGADLMVETLRGLKNGTVQPRPQDNSNSSLAPILNREDGLIDFNRSAVEILNRLRGFRPWPGAFTTFRGKQLHVWEGTPVSSSVPPGEIRVEADRLIVGCGSGTALELLEVQLEGKKRMAARDFVHGHQPKAGERMG
jgi:methionyl-tRNA formyltransferase